MHWPAWRRRAAEQRVAFGTSGHRGSSLRTAFNEAHIVATTQAICEYRRAQGTDGPLFLGRRTRTRCPSRRRSALEVLAANGVTVLIDAADGYTPTPAVSHAILVHNRGRSTGPAADGIVVTPSHNPPDDGGFKYNPPNGGPADTDATGWIAGPRQRAARGGLKDVRRIPAARARAPTPPATTTSSPPTSRTCRTSIDLDAIRAAGVRIGADPLGGASVDYWGEIAERHGLDLTVVNPLVDPTWRFMTLDWDGKIRMDCSSPYAMASLISRRSEYDIATGNDADSDRHGIVTPDGGLMNPNHYLAVAIEYLYAHRSGWNPDAGDRQDAGVVVDDRPGRGRPRAGRWSRCRSGSSGSCPGLLDGSIGFGGEESRGRLVPAPRRQRLDHRQGRHPARPAGQRDPGGDRPVAERALRRADRAGSATPRRTPASTRPATREQKAMLAKLSPEQVTATELAGEPITAKLTTAPGNGAAIGGLKVTTENGLVRRPAVRHRGRLQDLRRVVPGPRPPGWYARRTYRQGAVTQP